MKLVILCKQSMLLLLSSRLVLLMVILARTIFAKANFAPTFSGVSIRFCLSFTLHSNTLLYPSRSRHSSRTHPRWPNTSNNNPRFSHSLDGLNHRPNAQRLHRPC